MCWALPGMGPSGRSELPVPGSIQKDRERGWTDPELQLNHLEEAAENLDPGPLPDLWAQHLQGWHSDTTFLVSSREVLTRVTVCGAGQGPPPPTCFQTLGHLWSKGTYEMLTEGNLACPCRALGPRVPTLRQILQAPGPRLRALKLGCLAFASYSWESVCKTRFPSRQQVLKHYEA